MISSQRIRIRFVLITITLATFVLATALYRTQIIQGGTYLAKADQQYARPTSTLFDRGGIYFESKDGTRVAAAAVARGNAVYMNPKLISDAVEAYDAISEYLDIDRSAFMTMADDPRSSYREIAHKVDDLTAQSIMALSLKGIGVARESWRSYPGDSLAAHTLGLVGESADVSTIQGKYGLERYYEETLDRSGAGGSVNVFTQLFSGVREVFSGSVREGSLITTIEPTVEGYLEKILSDTNTIWHPDEIGGIIIDPRTGDIIAMASLPTFNGNDTSKVDNPSVFSNPLVEYVYEMGSIMKPLTIAVGLDAGVITPRSTYDDTGTMTVDDKTIGNWDRKAHGITTMQELLDQSLNIGAATVGLKIGNTALSKYFSSFGLGEKTGIDLPNEARGLISNISEGEDINVATASYGQGIAVSPIEMTRALSVLANGGYVIKPRVVKEIDYTDGSKKIISTEKGDAVLKKQTVVDVTSMLVSLVDRVLKDGAIKMERYSIAAKTGTAQIPDNTRGGYHDDRYLHSFFGYFPAYDPRFLVFIYQIHPKGANYASETLTDPFGNLAKFLINYYDVPPDR